jgi:hypothetical protein
MKKFYFQTLKPVLINLKLIIAMKFLNHKDNEVCNDRVMQLFF